MRPKWKTHEHISESETTQRTLTRGASAAFWTWIAYQTIKGLITTTLIWIPLAYYYFFA